MTKRIIWMGLILIGVGMLMVACSTPTPAPTSPPPPTEPPPEPTAVPVEVMAPLEVPFKALWEASGHNAVDTEAFRHWDEDDPAEVPTACARCHTTAGYRDFLGVDGSEASTVDAAVPAKDSQGIQCVACHNEVTTFQMTSVAFPGKDDEGNTIVVEGLGDAARCMVCHQGRASKASVDAQIERFGITDVDAVVAPIKDDQGNDVNFGFINIHYFAAAATLYGTEVKGGYEYDGKMYDAKFRHVEGYDSCIGCHNPHTLELKVNECANCHEGVTTAEDLKDIRMVSSASDYDGDGNVEEGVYYELQGLQELLLAEIQKYAEDKAGAAIVYDGATYPYFLTADGGRYANWTARLLKAAYNYQVSVKDPGDFAHGGKYIMQLLYDSIEDLGGDVSGLTRSDAGHFAGNTEAFRHWDVDGAVPASCARCHSATGLPQFLAEGANISNPIANGFACVTCHEPESFPELRAVTEVTFPSGARLSFSAADAEGNLLPDSANLCLLCHQGRESTVSVNRALTGKDADAVDSTISFRNVHYFAAGATLFGSEAQGAYQYEGKTYLGQFGHVEPFSQCAQCHDVHALEVNARACSACHTNVQGPEDLHDIRISTDDFDGDGDTAEGIAGEIETLAAALYAELQAYTAGTSTPIVYDSHAYPYFFKDSNGNGQAEADEANFGNRFNEFTPKSLKAAYNYQYSQKDPGAFAHNGKYVIQVLIDSIADLGGDVSGYARP